MAKYSYNELKLAAAEGRRIGAYLGKNVFACSKWKYDALKTKNRDSFYVLYDEDNKLVCDGIIYGTISDKGLVDELDRKRTWISPQSQVVVNFAPVAPKSKTVPATGYSAMVAQAEGNTLGDPLSSDAWFTKLDREINELLVTSKTRQYAGYEIAVK